MLRFDVYGRLVGITREDDRWRAVFIGAEGKHRAAPAIVIPPELREADLQRFLADLFHEAASPERPDVVLLGGRLESPLAGHRPPRRLDERP